jgi:hypothetical protein
LNALSVQIRHCPSFQTLSLPSLAEQKITVSQLAIVGMMCFAHVIWKVPTLQTTYEELAQCKHHNANIPNKQNSVYQVMHSSASTIMVSVVFVVVVVVDDVVVVAVVVTSSPPQVDPCIRCFCDLGLFLVSYKFLFF